MIDLVVIAVGILSILGAITGGADLSNYSNLTKVSKRNFDN